MEVLYPKVVQYKKEKFEEVKDLYQGLAKGQSPQSLLITCSDSRLTPNEFTQTKAGEVFVIRNAGNLVAEYNPENITNEALTVEYGVVALGVKEIIVCGHTSCGAMTGVLNNEKLDQVPLVQRALSLYKNKYESEIEKLEGLDDLIRWNVTRQLRNLYSYPFIKERVDSGSLNLWGWVFDFVNQEVAYKVNFSDLPKDVEN